MKLLKKIILFIALLIGSLNWASAKSIEDQVYGWLVSHQNNNTGLLGNQEEDDFSGIYPNALAAIAFIHKGETQRAEKIFDFFLKNFDSEFASGTLKGFHQFWNAASGAVFSDTDRWVGDNAWLLMVLNFYQNKTKNNKYETMQEGIAQWIISLQDEDGGINAGFNKNGPMNHKSTEGNLDCYVALINHSFQREKVLKYLTEKMWVESTQRFQMGSTVHESALDCCSWSIGALGSGFKKTMSYTEKKFLRTVTSDANGKTINGFSDFVDKKKVWLEGTGEMVVAYNIVGERGKAKKYLKELEKAMVKSEMFNDAMGLPCSTNDPSWTGANKKIFVPSQCWYLFGAWKINPMESQSLEQ